MSYDPQMHIVLYQPEIPHNTGAVGRTCVAVGAKLWLVRPLGFRLEDRYLRRSGLDYWPHLVWEDVADWDELLAKLGPRQYHFLTKHADECYTSPQYTQGDVFVFGSETAGLPEAIRHDHADSLLRIPMRPEVRSLNLSVSVGIVAYEADRQIRGAAQQAPTV